MIDWDWQLAIAQTNLVTKGSYPCEVVEVSEFVKGLDMAIGEYMGHNPPPKPVIVMLQFYDYGQKNIKGNL